MPLLLLPHLYSKVNIQETVLTFQLYVTAAWVFLTEYGHLNCYQINSQKPVRPAYGMSRNSPVLNTVFSCTKSNIKLKLVHYFTMFYVNFPKLLPSSSALWTLERPEIFWKINLDQTIEIHKNNLVFRRLISIIWSILWSKCSAHSHQLCVWSTEHKISTATT
jgi:hypothetical protein